MPPLRSASKKFTNVFNFKTPDKMTRDSLKYLRATYLMDNLGVRLVKAVLDKNSELEALLLKERDYIIKNYS